MSGLLGIVREKLGGGIEKILEERPGAARILIEKDSIVRVSRILVEKLGMRFLFLFAADDRSRSGTFHLRYIFSHVPENFILTVQIEVRERYGAFPSITPFLPQADWQEREIQDLFGLLAEGHPDPRRLVLHEDWPNSQYPLRKDFSPERRVPRANGEYRFESVEGDGVFEIPVGPVHAGIIEPGHFRFSCAGEGILKLEIRHFYTHKGTEKLGEARSPEQLILLAERISGDNSLSHAIACAEALEDISEVKVPPRAEFLRVIFLEMERLHNHVSDIAGIALDAGFAFGAAQLMRIKESLLRLNERIAGTRLLRAVARVGGVRRDIPAPDKLYLAEETRRIKRDFDDMIQLLWGVDSLVDRIKGTGILKKEIVEALAGVGPVARASGVDRDLRRDHSYAGYQRLTFMVPVFTDGDVESRMRVKIHEVHESIKLIHEALEEMPEGECQAAAKPLLPERSALGFTESPRGECFHWLMTDGQGAIARWKIHSPSFSNWRLIEHAVLENIVPDFPLINKSMNLSYSGNDR